MYVCMYKYTTAASTTRDDHQHRHSQPTCRHTETAADGASLYYSYTIHSFNNNNNNNSSIPRTYPATCRSATFWDQRAAKGRQYRCLRPLFRVYGRPFRPTWGKGRVRETLTVTAGASNDRNLRLGAHEVKEWLFWWW